MIVPPEVKAGLRRILRERGEPIATAGLAEFAQSLNPWYIPYPHHRRIIDALEAVERGEITRLMIYAPPRHGKSMTVSGYFPAWYLSRHPERRVILASYGNQPAERWSVFIRDQLADQRNPYGTLSAEGPRNAWEIPGYGGLVAAGRGGAVTGYGANLIVIDDAVKSDEEADSPTLRDATWDWYANTLYTRQEALSGGQEAAIVLIQTRWHHDDLAGRLLHAAEEGGDDWVVVELPAISEGGEALWPERYPVERLERTRAAIGQRAWQALYQQRPTAEEGSLFKREWFGIVDEEEVPRALPWVRYWDLAASQKESADYTACAAVGWDKDTGCIYVRDMLRGRWEWPDQQKLMVTTMRLPSERGTVHLIEEALHGLAAIQQLMRERSVAGVAIRGIRPAKDKVTRALPWAARAEAGKVKLVRGPWIAAFLAEVTQFPVGAHDDQVDTVSGAVASIPEPQQIERVAVAYAGRQPEKDPRSMTWDEWRKAKASVRAVRR